MPIRMSFTVEKKNEPPQVIIHKPALPVNKISNLHMFKQIEKGTRCNEQELNRRKKVEEILQELDSLVGLHTIKKLVLEIQAYLEIQKKREKENLKNNPVVLHMIFKGNPGTGKTTVARIVGRLFKEMGILEKGHVIEVERADLVGEYIGHTAHKTREQIKRALGGVLFVDEAYSLARGGEKDFGKESIDTLVKNMEEHKDNLILILAGYKQEMCWFLETNPGLRSRFPIQVDFPDYTIAELQEIAELMLSQRQYCFNEEAKLEMENLFLEILHKSREYSGNARLVRNIIEKSIRQQAMRLVEQDQVSRTDLLTITRNDILLASQN